VRSLIKGYRGAKPNTVCCEV